ncbi:MAG TPA: ABC transporter permease [Gemmataceae bacterium]|nr:ABC transporter permease [Gemmataceae bacterium]
MNSVAEALHNDVPSPNNMALEKAGEDPTAHWPVTIIERKPGWQVVDFHELWRYRELLFFLTWRDVKVRYKQTVLGAAWAILQPLANMVVFTVFLGRMAGISVTVPYSLYVFSGMLAWLFFSNAITSAGTSVIGNQSLVTKIYFPRLIIPTAAVGAGIVDFLIGFVILLVMQGWYVAHGEPVTPDWNILLIVPILLFLSLAALGFGALLAALTVAFRDFRYVVPFMIQIWMFATPTIYLDADTNYGPTVRSLLPLNPAYGLIYNFRKAMLGQALDWPGLGTSIAVSLIMLIIGCLYFRRVERGFADII